jgi:hypothetical protein
VLWPQGFAAAAEERAKSEILLHLPSRLLFDAKTSRCSLVLSLAA